MAFYGVGLKANDLGVNPYLTFFISALVELISLLIFSVAIQKFGRKIPYTGCLLVAAASLLTIYFIGKESLGFVRKLYKNYLFLTHEKF